MPDERPALCSLDDLIRPRDERLRNGDAERTRRSRVDEQLEIRRLPATPAATLEVPLTLPPGRASVRTSPDSTGSETATITMGMALVTAFAAREACVTYATMMSTLRRTRSATNSRRLANMGIAVPPRRRTTSRIRGVAFHDG
jgi:hypothetical protein